MSARYPSARNPEPLAMDGFFRLALALPELVPGDPAANALRQKEACTEAIRQGADLVLFPALSLVGVSLGDAALLKADEALAALEDLAAATIGQPALLVSSLPLFCDGALYPVLAYLGEGRVQALQVLELPVTPQLRRYSRTALPCARELLLPSGRSAPLYPADTLFRLSGRPELRFSAGSDTQLHALPQLPLQLLFSARPAGLGRGRDAAALMLSLSKASGRALAFIAPGPGESSGEGVYAGYRYIAEAGELLAAAPDFAASTLYADLDFDYLEKEAAIRAAESGREAPSAQEYVLLQRAERPGLSAREAENAGVYGSRGLMRPLPALPFLPRENTADAVSEEILQLLSQALSRRIRQIRAKKLILGLSGGLDSCLALLVALRSLQECGRPSEDLFCVSMPGPGSSERTRGNAEILARSAGADFREIPIGEAVDQHLRAIGHDSTLQDVTFENSQARERTQILMDLANQLGGPVLGTGDLSELALGWCTYNGDQMSMYAVNAAIPKTLARLLCQHEAERLRHGSEELAARIFDVLATPVSPELIPATDKGGQHTEDILGPYELHDFFLWQLLRRHARPGKIYRLACLAFAGRFEPALIRRSLEIFLRRFAVQQFKRSALPEGADIGLISLSPRSGLILPSDLPSDLFLSALERES